MKKFLLMAFALFCAAAMSQVPEFHQQYLQRIGGTLDEVNRQIEALDARAEQAEMDRYAYIRRLADNPDAVVRGEAAHLKDTLSRKVRLERIREVLRAAPAYTLAAKMLLWLDTDIAQRTLMDYKPAVPLTLTGLGHALAGFLIGYLLPLVLRAFLPRRVPVTVRE